MTDALTQAIDVLRGLPESAQEAAARVIVTLAHQYEDRAWNED